MKKMLDMVVTSNVQLNQHNHLLKVTPKDGDLLPPMFPGQFVQIRVDGNQTTFLRRPISVNFVDIENNEMWLLVQSIGEGTHTICQTPVGNMLNIIFPLGNSFTLPTASQSSPLLIGGGVGIAPMLFLGKTLHDKGITPTFILGGKSSTDVLELDMFHQYGNVCITTEDGSLGEKGFVTHHSILATPSFDAIYTCGPKPMMVAVAKYAAQHDIMCEVSLENLMACGFGACLCCVEKTIKGNICACTDGPVFNLNQLTWLD